MTPTRTIAPALAAVLCTDPADPVAVTLAKALAGRVQASATAIGLALRATAGPDVRLTKTDVAFLRQWQESNSGDPLTSLREASILLAPIAKGARTLTLKREADATIDLPRVTASTVSDDGRRMSVSIPKDTPATAIDTLKAERASAAQGHKALAWLDTLEILSAAWEKARARAVTWKVPTLKSGKAVTPGKRLESHAAALLAADEDKLKAVLVQLGLPAESIGVILAKAAATRAASAASAAALPAPAVQA